MTNQPSRDPANLSYAAVFGAMVAVVAVTALTIWGDLMPEIKDWLKEMFSHHWIGKGVIGAIVFCVSGLMAGAGKPKTEEQLANSAGWLFIITMVCILLLGVFFTYEAFLK